MFWLKKKSFSKFFMRLFGTSDEWFFRPTRNGFGLFISNAFIHYLNRIDTINLNNLSSSSIELYGIFVSKHLF